MNTYRHILVAVEMHDDGRTVLNRAQELADRFGTQLSVLHVVEYLPVDPAGDALLTTPVDLSRERVSQAETRLTEWCRPLKIPPERTRVTVGAITAEIIRMAAEIAADLIVVGHPPRKGLASLFSHTEEGVVTRAPCDVLVVHLGS